MTYSPEAIRDAYDEIAEVEDGVEKNPSLRNEIPREFIKRYLEASDTVLDAGGGAGINAILMAQRCQKVTLVDISPRMLQLAAINIKNAGLSGRIDLVQGDVTDLEQFGDAEFSFVVCVGGSLSYVLERGQQAIRELVRVAKKDSVLIVGCDSKYGFIRYFLRKGLLDEAISAYETSEYCVSARARARLYTVPEMTGLLERTGCEIVEVASAPMLMEVDQRMYSQDEDRTKWEKVKALELEVCAVPELLGMGHHLFCVARKV